MSDVDPASIDAAAADLSLLADESEAELVKALIRFPEVIGASARGVRPSTPGVSTSRTVLASAAAIAFKDSSAGRAPLASTSRTPRLRW